MSLERIEITPFAVIVGDILQQRRTGNLTVIRPPLRKVLYWSQGELVLISSAAPEDSLGDFLVRRGILAADRVAQILTDDPTDAVAKFHESGLLELSWRQTLLREWLTAQFVPLFSLDEGTAAFTEDAAIAPEKRVFLLSTAALVLEGIRSITNGLVLRRSLGDLKRDIAPGKDARYSIDSIPLNESERRIVESLRERQTIETFLKHFSTESVTAAKVVIAMMCLGLFATVDAAAEVAPELNADDMQRDLELLAAIGSSDQRSLRAVALSRQLASMDHYQVLDVPRGASRAQISTSLEHLKKKYEPGTFPPIVRDAVLTINRRIDEAWSVLKDVVQRQAYDKLLQQRSGQLPGELQKRLTQRVIAEQNFTKARDLSVAGDYYGAIVLLRQAVEFAPDHSQAWYLLGQCQERNPKWRRDAAESYQRALSIDPNNVDALISLGDLYKLEGLASRAQSCYEDVLKITPENQQAKSRLQQMGVKKR
ncbi:MAG TPA: tetratricopeptide repeat protein [Thermoanaerobaculia bacterium]|nr:tetratricopeptide repeat protein [Thermoanaerobaculia bacterium]